MTKLMDFICEWSISGVTSNFGESYKYIGKMLLEEDGWFEGLIKWPENSSFPEYQLVFGVLNEQGIELYKITSALVSMPFIYKCKIFMEDEWLQSYMGEFFVLDMAGEKPIGRASIRVEDVEKLTKDGYTGNINGDDPEFVYDRVLGLSTENEKEDLLKKIIDFKSRCKDFKKLYDDTLSSKQEISERIIRRYEKQPQVKKLVKKSSNGKGNK